MNDRERFAQLAAEQQFLLEAYVAALTRGRGGAEMIDELVNQTMSVAVRRFERHDASRPFGPWLRGIAFKVVRAHVRRESRRARIRGEGTMERAFAEAVSRRFDAFDPPQATQRAEVMRSLVECVQSLERDSSVAIRLHYWGGLAVADIAGVLKVEAAAVHKRLQRARARLARCLERKGVMVGPEGSSREVTS